MRWELQRFPHLLHRIGEPDMPDSARKVTAQQVLALRDRLPWEKATFSIHFAALTQFLRWGGNPIADSKKLWRLPSGGPGHRRWLTREQFEKLFRASRGQERLLIALEGLNGLRRVEVLRLRRKDVHLEEGLLSTLGKGRFGGKWRNIPMHATVHRLMHARLAGLAEDARLVPLSSSGADLLLARAAERAGFGSDGVRVSHHDLRRTFGRIAHESGMDLVQLKNLLGHASVEMTVHYIGLDAERMRSGLSKLSLAASIEAGRELPGGPARPSGGARAPAA
jgi:integrase